MYSFIKLLFTCSGEFSNAIKKSGLRLGLYHSLYEWFNPLYMKDKANNFTTKEFVEVLKLAIFNNLKKKNYVNRS